MRWRFLKLDLPYLLGELVIVVLGVSIAFAVEQWRTDRSELVQEKLFIDRLVQDIDEDVERWSYMQKSLGEKNEALSKAYSWLQNPDMTDEGISGFLGNLVDGAQRAYGAGLVGRSATFEEITNTGQLNALNDRDMKQQILDYFAATAREHRRVEFRITGYSAAIYKLIPREPEYRIDPGLTIEEQSKIVERVLQTDIEGLIIAERNLGRLMSEVIPKLSRSGEDLVTALRIYQEQR
jgi:hypothetical protein